MAIFERTERNIRRGIDGAGAVTTTPYQQSVTYRDGLVRVFSGHCGVSEWPEEDHPECQVSIPRGIGQQEIGWHGGAGSTARKRVRQGALSVVAPRQPHCVTWTGGHITTVYFSPDLLATASRRGLDASSRVDFDDTLLEQMTLQLVAEVADPEQCDPLYVDSLSQCLALHACRALATEHRAAERVVPLGKDQIADLREYVRANLSAPIRLAQLAGVAGMSSSHFSRAFRTAYGEPPYRYVTRLRIAAARELLETTGETIADISVHVRFATQSRFTTVFRSWTGVTPHVYRLQLGVVARRSGDFGQTRHTANRNG